MLFVLMFSDENRVVTFSRGCDLKPEQESSDCHTDAEFILCEWYCDTHICNDKSGVTDDGESGLRDVTTTTPPPTTITQKGVSRQSGVTDDGKNNVIGEDKRNPISTITYTEESDEGRKTGASGSSRRKSSRRSSGRNNIGRPIGNGSYKISPCFMLYISPAIYFICTLYMRRNIN